MSEYFSREATPLKYHKLIRYISLPLSIILTPLYLYYDLSKMEVYFWFYTLEIIFSLTCEILSIMSYIGFRQWKRYSWYSFMALLGVNTGFMLICVIIMLSYAPDKAVTYVFLFADYLIIGIPTVIYYKKRKRLFFDTYIPMSLRIEESCNERPVTSIPEIRFCRKCGAKLKEDSVFCHACGERIVFDIGSEEGMKK